MKHLTYEQRYTIQVMLEQKYTIKEIAAAIKKSPSTVSREIARNCDKRSMKYKAKLAQKKATQRHKSKRKYSSFTSEIESRVEEYLKQSYSPEQIVGHCKRKKMPMVSHERIYEHIWEDKRRGGSLYKCLRRKGKKYQKRGLQYNGRGHIKNAVSIDERPIIVDKRERVGDLEIDTIIGKNHKGAIVTINDRCTGMLYMELLSSRCASELKEKTVALLRPHKKHIKTITSDNGKEFAFHKEIARELGIQFYFAHPYRSNERGSNENLNGLVRQYIPKKTNFDDLSDNYIKYVEGELNNRPRKRFNYDTPNNVHKRKIESTPKSKIVRGSIKYG